MASKAQIRATARYDKTHTSSIMLKLNNRNDSDVLKQLDMVKNRQGYIKDLIRRDMQRRGEVMAMDSLRNLILPIALKYGYDRIYLFGSYARGEARPDSDVDILTEGGHVKGLLEFAAVQSEFENALGRHVDLVERAALEGAGRESARRLLRHIEKEGIEIYDRRQF